MNELCCVNHPEDSVLEVLFENKDFSGLSVMKRMEIIGEAMKQQEQVSIPVGHAFSDGIYLRQIFIPKGTLVMSRYHTESQVDVMMSGELSIVTNDGIVRIKAPMISQSPAGMKRLAYAHEDTWWMDMRHTNETDIQKLDKMLFCDTLEEFEAVQIEKCRDDYSRLLIEYGFSPETARDISVNEEDQISIELDGLYLADSKIEGTGLFVKDKFLKGDLIAKARIDGKRTQAGRYTNHSVFPNAEMVLLDNGDFELRAIHNIYGEEEITIDYRNSLNLNGLKGV